MSSNEDGFKEVKFGTANYDATGKDDGFKEVKFGANANNSQKPVTAVQAKPTDNFKVTKFGASNNEGSKADGDRGRYDVCIVFPTNPNSGGFTSAGEDTMRAIESSGADCYSYYDSTRTKIFVLIRYPLEKLTKFADVVNFKMLLDGNNLERLCKAGDVEARIAPFEIGHDPSISEYKPYEYIYCRYEYGSDHMYYKAAKEHDSFSENIRLKVIHLIFETSTINGGAGLKMRKLELHGKILAYYPMPNLETKYELQSQWLKTCMTPNGQPFDLIKKYFGEKITLFFEFRAHLTAWLFTPAIVGLALEAVVVKYLDFSNPVIPFFSLFIAIWSVLMTEYWKRREISVAMRSGMTDMEMNLTDRPEFIGREKPSLINGSTEIYYPRQSARAKLIGSFTVIFVNNYSSFYFLAFIAGYLEVPSGANQDSQGECGYPDCMQALAVNLGIIFGSRLVMKNTLNFLIPWYITRRNRMKEEKNAGSKALSPAEQEFIKQPFDLIKKSLTQYADVATFFGYTVFFTSALPAAPFFAWINTYLDIRFNAYAMLQQYRRPVLTGAQDIGTWQSIFEIASTIGVITNAGLIVFTMKTLTREGFTTVGKLWIFIGFQWVLFGAQIVIRAVVPDEPAFVSIQRGRTAHIASKIIDKVRDDDDDSLVTATKLIKVSDIGEIKESAPGM